MPAPNVRPGEGMSIESFERAFIEKLREALCALAPDAPFPTQSEATFLIAIGAKNPKRAACGAGLILIGKETEISRVRPPGVRISGHVLPCRAQNNPERDDSLFGAPYADHHPQREIRRA